MTIYSILFVICVFGVQISHGYITIRKGVGIDQGQHLTISDPTTDLGYYELDLYYNQYICIKTDGEHKNIYKIAPLNDFAYYTSPPKPELITSKSRESRDIRKTVPVTVEKSGNNDILYYNDNEKPKQIVKMYFDLLDSSSYEIVGAIQINVMPEVENIDSEDVTDYTKLMGKSRVVRYYKEIRQGVKWRAICDSSKRTTLKAQKQKTVGLEGKLQYTAVNSSNFNPGGYAFLEIDLTDGSILKNEIKSISGCVQNDETNLAIYHYFEHKGFSITGWHQPPRIKEGIFDVNENLISMDVPSNLLYPDCLNEFIDPVNRVIKAKHYLKGSKLTNMSRAIKILDIGRANRYNNITLKCKVENGSDTPDLFLNIKPNCDLTNQENIDRNKISCTIFMDQKVKGYTIYKDKTHSIRKVAGGKFYYLENPEKVSLNSEFKIIPSKDLSTSSIEVTEKPTHISLTTSEEFEVKKNPIFMLIEDKSKQLKGIVRIYVNSDSVKSKSDHVRGGLEVEKYEIENSVFLKLDISSRRTSLRCDKLVGEGYTLYPKGKNTVYRNVSSTENHPSTFEEVQFEQLFGSSGVTILKRPETKSDLEIILDEDYEITADHFRPIYFICAKDKGLEEHKIRPEKYAVIAVDPIYSSIDYRGCGLKTDLFVDLKGKETSGDSCQFDLKKTSNVRFHCPDYVPDHFLGDKQEKYKPEETDERNENPFKTLFRCYDRSTFFGRFFKLRSEVNVFKKRKSVSELRSLWSFDKALMKDQGISSVICVCYDKEGEPKSNIRVTI